MEIERVETVNKIVGEELVDVEDSLNDAEENMRKETGVIDERLKKRMVEKKSCEGIIFKVGRKILKASVDRVNEAVKYLNSNSITETNSLIVAASVWVAEQIGLKKIEYRKKNEPRWKRRNEGDIKRLRKAVNILERGLKGEIGERKRQKLLQLHDKNRVRKKDLKTVIEELKQRMIAKSAKIRRFEQRNEQFRQNRLFEVDEKRIYMEFNGGRERSIVVPNKE